MSALPTSPAGCCPKAEMTQLDEDFSPFSPLQHPTSSRGQVMVLAGSCPWCVQPLCVQPVTWLRIHCWPGRDVCLKGKQMSFWLRLIFKTENLTVSNTLFASRFRCFRSFRLSPLQEQSIYLREEITKLDHQLTKCRSLQGTHVLHSLVFYCLISPEAAYSISVLMDDTMEVVKDFQEKFCALLMPSILPLAGRHIICCYSWINTKSFFWWLFQGWAR